MRIFGAVGLGLTIVVLRILAPRIWAGLEAALVSFFSFVQAVLAHTQAGLLGGKVLP